MSDLNRYLTEHFTSAYDRFDEHMHSMDSMSLEDLKRVTPLQMEMLIAQWAASLEIKTKHDLSRSGIDAIR